LGIGCHACTPVAHQQQGCRCRHDDRARQRRNKSAASANQSQQRKCPDASHPRAGGIATKPPAALDADQQASRQAGGQGTQLRIDDRFGAAQKLDRIGS
jgi:hypothetical protein